MDNKVSLYDTVEVSNQNNTIKGVVCWLDLEFYDKENHLYFNTIINFGNNVYDFSQFISDKNKGQKIAHTRMVLTEKIGNAENLKWIKLR